MSTPEEPTEVPTYRTDPVPVEPEEPAADPPPLVPYGPAPTSLADFSVAPDAGARVGKLPKALFLIPVVAALVVVIAVVGAIFATGGDDGGVLGGDPEPEVLTAQGYDELVAAVEEETGSTTVFDAVLYPAYAVVSIPVDATTKRQESWYWDGTDLRSNDSKSTASFDRFDLAGVDGAVVVDLVDQVRTLVEDPTSWYAIVRTSDADGATMWAYARNEYGETAYLGARADGTITYDSTEH